MFLQMGRYNNTYAVAKSAHGFLHEASELERADKNFLMSRDRRGRTLPALQRPLNAPWISSRRRDSGMLLCISST